MFEVWTSPEIVGAVLRLCGLLKLFGADVTQRGVTSAAVIEHFDIFKDALTGFFSRKISFMMNQFLLQCGEETFHHGVIPTVAFAAHTTADPIRC